MLPARKILLIACGLMSLGSPVMRASAQPQPVRSPRNANYTIDVRLDPRTRGLVATERIGWRNITSRTTRELQFHLYWNAWADTRSTWMREGGARRSSDRPADDFSRLEVTSMRLVTGGNDADLMPSRRFISPDDGNGDDRTVMAVTLPAPVEPGETIEVELAWTARVPRTFDRTGTIGAYYFIAQWFPKLGVLEDSGWNCHQFHKQTEFFSDYGVYDVSMTVPVRWVVGATGRATDQRDNGDGTATHRYVQEDVHDFAWTTSPDFLPRTTRFEAPGLPPVDVRLLLQPEHASQAERHFAAARSALLHYGTWFGAYPYGHLTIVDPAFQSDTGGMEYPTLFTAGTHWWITDNVTLETPEEVVIHEAGHQFWYGIVGTNEFEHAWMDEGVNTFATARAIEADYPPVRLVRYYFGGFVPWVFGDVRLRRESTLDHLFDYRRGASEESLSTETFRQRPETVATFAYSKPAVWLHTLERWLGWPILQGALADTFVESAFHHPDPEVLLHHLQMRADRDLTPFLDQTYRGSALFDYSVASLSSARDGEQFETVVLVRRLQDGVFPIAVRVTFENGEEVLEHWDGAARWKEFKYVRRSRARSAVVDPDRQLLLDLNFTNNSRTLAPRGGEAATKWSLRFMIWLQDCLLTWGLLA
jgi:hypothetical protein